MINQIIELYVSRTLWTCSILGSDLPVAFSMIYLERVFHSVVFCLILTRPLLWQSVIYLSLLWWITQQAQLVWELFQTLEQMTDLDSFEGLRAFHSHVMSGLYKQSAEELTAEPLGSYIHAQNPPNHQLLPKSDQVGTWTQNFLLPLCGPELQVYLPIHSFFFLTFSFPPSSSSSAFTSCQTLDLTALTGSRGGE